MPILPFVPPQHMMHKRPHRKLCSPTSKRDVKVQESGPTVEESLAGLEEEFKVMTLNSDEPGRLTQALTPKARTGTAADSGLNPTPSSCLRRPS